MQKTRTKSCPEEHKSMFKYYHSEKVLNRSNFKQTRFDKIEFQTKKDI